MVGDRILNVQEVKRLLSDPRINFVDMDRKIVQEFDANVLSKISDLFVWIEEQKEIAKEILRKETGRVRLPKTPKHQCVLSEEAKNLQKFRKKLLEGIMPQKEDVTFANERGGALCDPQQTPKPSRHPARRIMKTEPMSGGILNDPRTPKRPMATPKQHLPIQRTPLRPVTPRQNVPRQQTPYKATTNHRAIPASENNTPKRTPVMKTPLKSVQTPKLQPVILVKRSEVLRKMESRTNTVIKNKEELMREKAERTRKEREERELRVRMNIKKKEEEALEKNRIFRMREEKIQALKQEQRGLQRAISKSPCRTRGYYNRMQKPMVRAISSQDIITSKGAFQTEVPKGKQEKPQPQGKRSRNSSAKYNINADSERQKLVRVDSSETSAPRKLPSKSPVVRDVPEEKRGSGQVPCKRSGSTRTSRSRGKGRDRSEDSVHTAIEAEEASAAEDRASKKRTRSGTSQSKRSSRQSKRSRKDDGTVDSGMASALKSREESKENVDEKAAQDMEVEAVSANPGSAKNKTSSISMEISDDEAEDDTANNYNVNDISSNDETDDEEHPRKPIPLWAQGERLQRALRKQATHPPIDPDTFFGSVRTPQLSKIFARNRARYNKRTSSEKWSSPLSNPKIGKSKFFELQNVKRADK